MNNKIIVNTQSSIKIIGEKIIYIDPYKIEDDYKDADYIFITHNHYDHFDLESLIKILKIDTKLIIPNSIFNEVSRKVKLPNIIGVNPKDNYNVDNLEFSTYPSYNIEKQFHPESSEFVGYLINSNQEKIYISGDTDYIKELNDIKCDIALIPIGGTYTMTYEEAANLINTIKPHKVIPTHYGSIVGDISLGEKFKKLIDPTIEVELQIK